MKILTLVDSLGKGGVQRTAETFAVGYQQAGHVSRLWATRAGGEREKNLQAANIPYWLGISAATVAEIEAWNPDVVHIHSHGFSAEEINAFRQIFKNRLVVEKNVFSRPNLWTAEVQYSYQLSEWCLWRFCLFAPQMVDKARLVPNAVVASAFQRCTVQQRADFRKQYAIPEQALVIGRIGQNFAGKWSPILVQSFEKIACQNENVYLLVVNPAAFVEQQIKRSLYKKRIIVIDKISGDAALSIAYSAMDVFALAAEQGESFGNVLTEALLCEVPIVALSTPWQDNSQCEVVGHEQGGLIALSPKGFTKALETLLDDASLRHKLALQGKQRVLQRYNVATVIQESLAVMEGKKQAVSATALQKNIIALYKQAVEKPTRLTILLLRWQKALWLLPYTTGYKPWWQLPVKVCHKIYKKIKGI